LFPFGIDVGFDWWVERFLIECADAREVLGSRRGVDVLRPEPEPVRHGQRVIAGNAAVPPGVSRRRLTNELFSGGTVAPRSRSIRGVGGHEVITGALTERAVACMSFVVDMPCSR
jgi:hypothetical protein